MNKKLTTQENKVLYEMFDQMKYLMYYKENNNDNLAHHTYSYMLGLSNAFSTLTNNTSLGLDVLDLMVTSLQYVTDEINNDTYTQYVIDFRTNNNLQEV